MLMRDSHDKKLSHQPWHDPGIHFAKLFTHPRDSCVSGEHVTRLNPSIHISRRFVESLSPVTLSTGQIALRPRFLSPVSRI